MAKYISALVAILALAFQSTAQEINWEGGCHQGYYFGISDSKTSNKPLFILFTRDSCIRCEQLKAGALRDPTVVNLLNSRFICVKINSSLEQDYQNIHKIVEYPTLLVWDIKNDIQDKMSTQSAGNLISWLNYQLGAYNERRTGESMAPAISSTVVQSYSSDRPAASTDIQHLSTVRIREVPDGQVDEYRVQHAEAVRRASSMPSADYPQRGVGSVPYPDLDTLSLNEVILKRLNSIDDGVKGLKQQNEQLREATTALRRDYTGLDDRVVALEKQMKALNQPTSTPNYPSYYQQPYYTQQQPVYYYYAVPASSASYYSTPNYGYTSPAYNYSANTFRAGVSYSGARCSSGRCSGGG